MKSIAGLIAEQPLLAPLGPEVIALLAGCARNARFTSGEYLFREGELAGHFCLLREGRVALQVATAGRPPLDFQTLGPGDLAGVSWLVPPYRWSYDARAITDTRALVFDACCLREKCDADPQLGYRVMKCFLPVLVQRLQAVRWQVLDVYGSEPRA
jgi:CRP/FNR family transcriptional regulator, cyclic AMP receptor protein